MLIATTCTVLFGFLLLDREKEKLTNLEMRGYLSQKTPKITVSTRHVYNPFALTPKTPAPHKQTAKKNWVVADADFDVGYKNRQILNDIVHASGSANDDELMSVTMQAVVDLFDDLKLVKLAFERYLDQQQLWPSELSNVPIETLPKGVSAITLSGRGKFTVKLRMSTDVIHFSPDISTKKHIKWFCQTTLESKLLGRGINRLCIHSSTAHIARDL